MTQRIENGSIPQNENEIVVVKREAGAQPESGESNELTLEQTAQLLYDMGFRLSNPLDIPLTDTNEEIELTNVYAPVLSGYWADGTNRDVSGFYRKLGVPDFEDAEGMSIDSYLYRLTLMNVESGSANQLIGTKEHSFLTDPSMLEKWGALRCFVALIQAGEKKPWEWIPEEMLNAIVEELKYENLSNYKHTFNIDNYSTGENILDLFLENERLTAAIVYNLLNVSQDRDKRGNYDVAAERFFAQAQAKYPELIHEVYTEYVTLHQPSIFIGKYVRLLGPEYIKLYAEKAIPDRESKLYYWLEYMSIIYGKQVVCVNGHIYLKNGNDLENIVIDVPFPLFRQEELDDYSYEFATPENIRRQLEMQERRIEAKKEELLVAQNNKRRLEALLVGEEEI